ncbi:hypothetical protein GCM10010211_33840 [Streptomyces albospinus]|uniref:DUF362 domain-containing protein n=1 Tax=Streptomyces albospinus TaxID=285515 RepID=A0ABQ2V2G0_9ACTN|nr:DUF362 domain-containing protein [Streptomyces albospinus]GGU65837.1 hypothetical protein GCM10010211_33840 [Streptomyces albospinus]
MKMISHDEAAVGLSRAVSSTSTKDDVTPVAAVVRSTRTRPLPPARLLADAVTRAGLWQRLAERAAGDPGGLAVMLTPGASAYGDPTTAVSAVFVEQLIDLLCDRGYRNITVGASRCGPDVWLEGPGLLQTCRRLGYGGRTQRGNTYRIVDLSEDIEPAGFPASSVLHGSGMARTWLAADFRINIAKNSTHPEFGYALCLANLLGVLPHADKHHHYRARRDGGEVIVDLLRSYAPDFHIIDAVVSSHGCAGSYVGKPLGTGTVIAAPDGVLADMVGALLMHVDPISSPLNARVLRDRGLPDAYHLDGDLTPYQGWRNPPRALVEAVRRLAPDGRVHRLFSIASWQVTPGTAEVTDPALARLSRLLTALIRVADENPAASAALCTVVGAAASASSTVRAWRTGYGKEKIRRRDVSLAIDPDTYTHGDFDRINGLLQPLEEVIDALPADAWLMRWQHLGSSILFGCERTVNAPYAEFVRRVDISRTISYMTDYLGGRVHVVSRDAQGRPTRQIERNLYLAQPNYMAFYGGPPIDVCKLESISYEERSQRIAWRTVHSPNGSAEYDDGSVAFLPADGGNRTRIVVRVRQRFTLPLTWQVFRPETRPKLRDPLVQDSYRRFFTRTLDNFEAQYEGRPYRIGRAWEEHDDMLAAELPTQRLTEAARLVRSVASHAWSVSRLPGQLGPDGFRHVAPGDVPSRFGPIEELREELRPAVTGFWQGLREAVAQDRRSR